MTRGFRRATAAVVAVAALAAAAPAFAEEYDPQRSGHPLRILAYVLHPIGYALEYLVFRPAHWVISHHPIAEIVGETKDTDY